MNSLLITQARLTTAVSGGPCRLDGETSARTASTDHRTPSSVRYTGRFRPHCPESVALAEAQGPVTHIGPAEVLSGRSKGRSLTICKQGEGCMLRGWEVPAAYERRWRQLLRPGMTIRSACWQNICSCGCCACIFATIGGELLEVYGVQPHRQNNYSKSIFPNLS